MRLEGKNAIVTGAGSGIGRAAAELFAAEGANVVAVDLAVVPGFNSVVGSVADPELWDEAVAAAGSDLDVVYLNAGVYGFHGPIDELPLDVFQRTIDANIAGVVLGVRAAVPAMRRHGGAIVVTASVAGVIAFEGNPIYTLTKQAVAGFVRALAPSLAPDGITIDAVCPGVVDTPMTVEALGGSSAADRGIPLIPPQTIAEVALDLATTDGTGRCRVVREMTGTVDWTFPSWADLFTARSD